MTAKRFAAEWTKRKSVEELLEGAHRRQDKLVGIAIDAAVVTHICHELANGKTLNSLRTCLRLDENDIFVSDRGPTLLKLHDLESTFKTLNDSITDKKERLKVITDIVLNMLVKQNVIVNHLNITDDTGWDKYVRARSLYLSYDNPFGHGVSKPQDPRVIVCNERVGASLTIKDNGAKTLASVESKLARKSTKGKLTFNASVDIKDINRIMILPTRPEVADTFYKVMEWQTAHSVAAQAADVGDDYRNRRHLFVENWAVKPWGPFDRKAYVALHNESNGSIIEDDVNVAEIKAVGPAMDKAERLTALIYALQRELDDIRRYFPPRGEIKKEGELRKKGDKTGNYQEERLLFQKKYDTLSQLYNILAEDYFEDRIKGKKGLPPEFCFPPPIKDFDRAPDYENLRLALIRLNQEINIDALKHEQDARSWAEKFAFTAYYQHAARAEASWGKARKHQITDREVETARFDEGLLKRIGLNSSDLAILSREAFTAWREDRPCSVKVERNERRK